MQHNTAGHTCHQSNGAKRQKEGLEISKAVKRELPGWMVTYWDESLDWFLSRDPRNYKPPASEYEITLKDAIGKPGNPGG